MEIEMNGHRVCLMILRCKAQLQRTMLCFGTLKRADAQPLRDGMEWALSKGFIQWGSRRVTPRAWSRGESSHLLYLTKAGKAWLRELGGTSHDFGASKLYAQTSERARMMRTIAVSFSLPAANANAVRA